MGVLIMLMMFFGINVNSIFVMVWCLMEVIEDKLLFEVVWEEVNIVLEIDFDIGVCIINM